MNDHVRSDDLAAYVDGRLSVAKRNELESHCSLCPACLDELADLAVIMGGRDRISASFLKLALGEKTKPAPSPLRLRLVFEVAASLLVVVFIGYFFLGTNRFRHAFEKQTPSDLMTESKSLPAYGAADRLREPGPPAAQPREQGKNEHMTTGWRAPGKVSRATAIKDVPAATDQVMFADKEKGAMPQIAPTMPQPAAEMESLPKPELQRVELKSKGLDSARLAAAASSRPTAQTMDMKAVQIQQNQQQEKQVAGAMQTADPIKKLAEAPSRKAVAEQPTSFPVRIAGDVGWSNLQNPEQIASWSWFPNDLVLELQIDQSGTVTTVVAAAGKVDERLAAQAASEAKKLIFAISEKKSRRARLVAKDAPPD